MRKNLLSATCVILFAMLAMASAVNKIHYGAFNYNNNVEDKEDTRNYIVKNDGTKVYGNKVTWKSGFLTKDQIQIDDQKFKITEVSGYQKDKTYYGRFGKEYIQRIVHGKINVYVQFVQVTSSYVDHNGVMTSHNATRTYQYAQKGETGPMTELAGQDDIKKLVSDCSLAVQLADISNTKMRKAIRKNRNYLNNIFEIYNNGCQETKSN
ncbi:MAG: hypothetical protein ACXVBT_08035 [Flavisolibacter sp.]